jgi:predicted helicase
VPFGSDLDRLTPDDFNEIANWLRGEPSTAKKKRPLPHQEQALANILPALQSHDRATAVMSRGTGKTLVALWVSERLNASKVLILVPSLALLRQTLHEWLKESNSSELIYMCVCSDPTVVSAPDSLNVQQSDLDFPVTTDNRLVERFLSTDFDGVKMIFSTYQSARVVADAMRKEDVFDFGIFDEAHKTAGRIGVRFGFAVSDDNLPIEKRLFLTATPRHFDFQHKDKEGEAKGVYSMDVPEVYGPRCHTLSFAEAARRDIICPYKVVVSVVTSQMVYDERLRRGEVIIDGDVVGARHVAN